MEEESRVTDEMSPTGRSDFFSPRRGRKPMLLLHLDINKTVIQSDSIQMKSIEEGIREGIAELFWGTIQEDNGQLQWSWCKNRPTCTPPEATDREDDDNELHTYASFCKKVGGEKEQQKISIRSFRLVQDEEVKAEMNKVLDLALKKLQLPSEVRYTDKAEAVGLKGSTIMMFPAVFHLVATLQRAKRKFAILFRSFGADHQNIKQEWNSFCEMTHPLYSNLIEGIGKMDGSVPGVPDRRIKAMHTLYRDAQGPLLVIDKIVEEQKAKDWDAWARKMQKGGSRPQEDTRDGRDYILNVLKSSDPDNPTRVAVGLREVRAWMMEHLEQEQTSAIKDDWAWWAWNDERSSAGKLLTVFPEEEDVKQIFFDDNVHHRDPRIVDCRYPDGTQVPPVEAIDKLCCKVNSVEAIIDDEYFLRKLQICHGGNLLINSSLIDFRRQMTEVEEQKSALEKEIKDLQMQLKSITEENRRMKITHRIEVETERQLRDLMSQTDLDNFGKDGFKKLHELHAELQQGLCWLELDADKKPVRMIEMLFVKVVYKAKSEDQVLIESHEQYSDGRIVSLNFLPGVVKRVKESSFDEALQKFFSERLEVDLKECYKSGCIKMESPPAFNPEASSRSVASDVYPIESKVQQFEATLKIDENWQKKCKSSKELKEAFGRIGLPTGKNFTAERKEGNSGKITHFYRWDKLATFEATSMNATGKGKTGVNVAEVCEKCFGKHPYREVYENLLLQMFETFSAKKLCGGFSGSMVIRVQPFEKDGRPGEPCIVKLDRGEAIKTEHQNSVQVCEALPDRAARIIGDAAYAKNEKLGEFGAMRLELAGACWNVPELATGSSNLLSTFKDLLLYESELMMLGAQSTQGREREERNDTRPFGSVNSVLAETFGPGGMVSSLRKGGKRGVNRPSNKQLMLEYTLKGKETDYNPYVGKMKDTCTAEVMRQMYTRHFGTSMPDLKELVVETIKPKLEALAKKNLPGLRPLVGLAHGDLNAANIMIDALDAVWLIDFATSVELPLFTDLCKFEMACLFEYSIVPITVENFADLCGSDEDHWEKMGVGDWIGVQQDVATAFLRQLQKRKEKISLMDQAQLDSVVNEAVAHLPAHKQHPARKAILSRLVVSQAKSDSAFHYCANISKSMLDGDGILDTLRAQAAPVEGPDKFTGCASLRYFVDITKSIRLFMLREIQLCFRELPAGDLEVCDALSLQMWLPFLRESYRIVGYRDIPPQKKLWSIYHCTLVAKAVLRTLDMFSQVGESEKLRCLRMSFNDEIMKNCSRSDHPTPSVDLAFNTDHFTEADSRWVHAHGDLFDNDQRHCRIVQCIHAECEIFAGQPGLYAPIFQVLQGYHGSEPHGMLLLGSGVKPCSLSFGPKEERDEDKTLPWRLRLKAVFKNPRSSREHSTVVLHLGESEDFGEMGPGKTPTDPPEVRLHSRLAFIPHNFLVNNLRYLENQKKQGFDERVDGSFNLKTWFPDSRRLCQQTIHPQTTDGWQRGERMDRPRRSTMGPAGRGDTQLLVPDRFLKFTSIQAAAFDESGKEMATVELCLGMPVPCYPGGSRVCLAMDPVRSDGAVEGEFVILNTKSSGNYTLHRVHDENKNWTENLTMSASRNYRNFADLDDHDLKCNNHIYLNPVRTKVHDNVVLLENSDTWVNATMSQPAKIDESYRHTLIIERSEKVDVESEDTLIAASAAEDSMSLSQFPRGLEDETALRYLSDQVCCQALLNATAFEEELHKIKAFYRARHSSIIDALSGTRLDVRTCVIPQLTVSVLPGNAAPVPPPALEMQKSGSSNLMVPPTPSAGMASRCSVLKAPSRTGLSKRGSGRTVSTNADHRATRAASEAAANHQPHFHDELAGMQDQSKLGWKLIDAALERFNKATPSCLPSAFWVIGAPGSGKNTLMCRVIMDSVSRYDNLVPLRLPILDLAKRSTDQMPELALPSVQAWFDKYLRILFGEDTPRYKMMKMAISMRRALFLFEGLDAAGQLREAVEILIQGFVKEGHFLLMTSRRLPQGSSLESLPEHIVAMEMQPLSDEQKRAIAHSRLGLQGLQSFNTFLTKIRRGQRGSDGGETQEQDDIFGNPMMLSMLLCYLSPKAGDETEHGSPATDGEGVDLMAVYRVSVTVMLKRMLLQQQADRHINEELLEDCSRVLERAAMNMQAKRDTQIECEAFEKELTIQLKERWTKNLRASVDLGRAMLLRMHREGNRTMIRFMIKGFQDYFSACAISKGDDSDHLLDQVSYQALLKDGWWAQMLDMLAQAWPKQYVQLMEKKIDKFKDEHGGSALHLAAKVGHVPIFRLVKKFSDANQVLSAKNAEDQTPLHVAAENGHHAVCQLIIEKKGSVDVEDSKERLPLHLALQSGHFSLARFLLDKLEEEASMQPAAHSNQKKEDLSERLARRILAKTTGDEPLDEEDFLGEVPNIFPEMKYFRKEEQNEYKRQMASLLSVYWVCSDDYDSFARMQSAEEKLTMGSWEGLQEWAKNKVQMTPRRVAAVLVYCAIAGIGKIAPFQKHFAADATEPISALASIVQRHSVLVPSFQRLDDEEQHLILGCLKAHANFNFGQFLQAESLPVSLFKCKELLTSQEETMSNVFGFFLFTVFMSLCAILGVKSLEGSLFMTEEMYKNFKVGLESLSKLTDADPGDVYNGFLRKRAELAGVEFDEESPTLEQKAIVRLSCLTRIFEKEKGGLVFEAFMSLPPGVREELTSFLNADGLSKRGFLLMHSPNLMCNAFQNKNLSLDKAMRQLLKMYQLSEEAFPAPPDGEAGVITVMVEEMATHAKKCEDAESFDSTNLEVSKFQGVNADRTAKIVLSPWQNNTDKRLLISLDEDVGELFYDVSIQTVTETSFIQRLKTCFPELKYLDGDDLGVPELRKRTLCTMLCIYWLAGDRHEEFIRGQAVASQLQESSWQWIQQWISPMLEDQNVMNVVCAAVMVKAVCRIPKFQKQQAPGILDLRDVMKHVLENCPKVLPSYQRLEEDDRQQLAECLSHDIELERLVNAESCPAGLGVVRELVQLSRDAPEVATRRSFDSLSLLLWSSFLDLAGSMGNESQEGSFYMTEDRYQKIHIAQESLQKMRSDSCSETEVYDFLLERRVEKHVTFEPDPESKACARLACLANIRNSSDAADVREALCSSEVLKTPEERARMVRYLTSTSRERHSVVEPEAAEEQTPSALVERPSFALREATSFLEKARDNPEIGISQATRILLRVFDEATKEFNGVDAAMVHIDFTELASFAADFVGSAKFQDVPFELKRTTPTAFEATVIPKVWIPVSNEQVLEKLKKNAVELCMDLRDHKLPERVFRDRIAHIYPEMAYFGPNATNLANQTVCSLCCVYWLLSNQHEAFIRGQPSDCQLSRQSWAWIQDWLQKSVRLTTPEKIDAVLTIMAIHALGKFPAFRADFPSVKHHTQEMHDLALAQILQNNPEVVPSFNRLDAETKQLIIDCLSVDFEFSQFLLGENTAANLVMVKDRLKGHGQNGHSFFLFRIFAQMCGKLGPKSQSGCLFMNENQFKRCTPGLKALQALWKLDGKACYNDFILLRGSKAMSRFASPEHQALSRLLCLFDAYDKEGGSALCNAFDELAEEERRSLTQWLNSDSEKCCVIIPGASTMLQAAKANTFVGLPSALRFMLKVREQCQQHEKNSSCSRRVIQFGNIATWAKDYRGDSPGEFWEVCLDSKSTVQGDTQVITMDPQQPLLTSSPTGARSGSLLVMTGSLLPHRDEMQRTDSQRSFRSPHTTPLRRTRLSTDASPLRSSVEMSTQTPQRSEAATSPAPPGRTPPRIQSRLPIGRWGLGAVAFVWCVVAAWSGDSQITFSWRQLLLFLLFVATVVLAIYVRRYDVDIPLESDLPEVRHFFGPAEPFLTNLGVFTAPRSREPRYSRLPGMEEGAP